MLPVGGRILDFIVSVPNAAASKAKLHPLLLLSRSLNLTFNRQSNGTLQLIDSSNSVVLRNTAEACTGVCCSSSSLHGTKVSSVSDVAPVNESVAPSP
jgi:hypothetical protein